MSVITGFVLFLIFMALCGGICGVVCLFALILAMNSHRFRAPEWPFGAEDPPAAFPHYDWRR